MKRAANRKLKTDRYTYRVSWSPEDEEHVALCAEFPSLSWLLQSRICNPPEKQSPNRWLRDTTAANSASAFLPHCIARWHFRQRSRESALIVWPALSFRPTRADHLNYPSWKFSTACTRWKKPSKPAGGVSTT